MVFRLFFFSLLCFLNSNVAYALTKVQTARLIPIDKAAFSGTSINVVAGSRQTLYTDGEHQYAAYYREDAALVLARRQLGSDSWELYPTTFKTNPHDAHNTVSLVVDGDGYLHLAWGHHNSSLNYARSSAPSSLEMRHLKSMNEDLENSVTYPQFYALPNGNVLFAYRDGGSGRGNLVLKHYDVKTKTWTTRQRNLIDGENQRSAYWDVFVDANAVLHLAWNWRETPDVATNHDLFYARSRDAGVTWENSDSKTLTTPFNRENAERIIKIAQKQNLMNPPAVAADRASNPYVASYWSPKAGDKPQLQVLRKTEAGWRNLGGPISTQDFSLNGGGTKNPPISRAALFVESNGSISWPHLVYRDRALDGHIIATTYSNRDQRWTQKFLVDIDVGAWEPSADPVQWQRMQQIHMLVQHVVQQDGNDHSSDEQSSPISLLTWSPGREK